MSYELSDNPHQVGTVEHHRWIVDEYIPSLTQDQIEQSRKRAGAEAIGAKLIDATRRFSFTLGDIDLTDQLKGYSFRFNTELIIRAEKWQRALLDEWKSPSKRIDETLRDAGLS